MVNKKKLAEMYKIFKLRETDWDREQLVNLTAKQAVKDFNNYYLKVTKILNDFDMVAQLSDEYCKFRLAVNKLSEL